MSAQTALLGLVQQNLAEIRWKQQKFLPTGRSQSGAKYVQAALPCPKSTSMQHLTGCYCDHTDSDRHGIWLSRAAGQNYPVKSGLNSERHEPWRSYKHGSAALAEAEDMTVHAEQPEYAYTGTQMQLPSTSIVIARTGVSVRCRGEDVCEAPTVTRLHEVDVCDVQLVELLQQVDIERVGVLIIYLVCAYKRSQPQPNPVRADLIYDSLNNLE